MIFGGEQGDFGMRFNFLERGIHGYYPFNRPLKDRLNLADDGDVIYLLEESDLDWATPPPLTQRQQGLTRRFRQLINTANQQLARNLSALTRVCGKKFFGGGWGLGVGFYPFSPGQLPNFQGKST